jgi:hypothetical protein
LLLFTANATSHDAPCPHGLGYRFSVRSYMGRNTSRGDIIIGRSALSLKAWPSTHDTISHICCLDDGEPLPVA